jgi:hypothetical protein
MRAVPRPRDLEPRFSAPLELSEGPTPIGSTLGQVAQLRAENHELRRRLALLRRRIGQGRSEPVELSDSVYQTDADDPMSRRGRLRRLAPSNSSGGGRDA